MTRRDKYRTGRTHWLIQARAEADPVRRQTFVSFARACHSALMLERDRFLKWRARRRHAKHLRRLRKMHVVLLPPDPRCVVRNLREPN